MIFIDYNNIFLRYYSVSASLVAPDLKKKLKMNPNVRIPEDDYKKIKSGSFNLILKELLFLKKKFAQYGDLVICSDYNKATYWRKRHFKEYKVKHPSKPNPVDELLYKNMYQDKDELIELLHLSNIKVLDKIEINGASAEADDTIFVLATEIKAPLHLVYSVDEDYNQILTNTIKKYHPFKKAFVPTPTDKEKGEWALMSCVMGQSKDNVKPVTYQTEISDDFIKWMKTKHELEITKDMIDVLKEKYSYYMKEYEEEKSKEDDLLIESGKRKQRRYLDAYKKPQMGNVAAKKWIKDFDTHMKNPVFRENFEVNCRLMLYNRVDADIKQEIHRRYQEVCSSNNLDPIEVIEKNQRRTEKLLEVNIPGLPELLGKF